MGSAHQKRPLLAESGDEDWFYGRSVKTSKASRTPQSPKQKALPQRDGLVVKSLGIFETFPKQRLAMEKLASSHKIFKNSRIFSYEVECSNTGERRYLVTSIPRFWIWYEKQSSRHMYELIHEDSPCRLYFDLEFCKAANPGLDWKVMLDHFFVTLQKLVDEILGIQYEPERDTLMLDSSTAEKFSMHLICHFKENLLFPTNTAIRPFASLLQTRLLENPPHDVWNADKEKKVTIMDHGVYTKNRNFRLFLSAKAGKTACLQLSSYEKYRFYNSSPPSNKRIFLDSLCVPIDCEKYSILDLTNLDKAASSGVFKTADCRLKGSKLNGTLIEGQGSPSPYPQLDEFILMILRKWRGDAYFRQWRMVEGNGRHKSIIYYPANCRYCFNISRAHKSNGTYWTVDLEKKQFYQKCFDPECEGLSSNLFPLPKFIANTIGTNKNELDSSILTSEEAGCLFDESRVEVGDFFSNWDQVFDFE